MVAHQAPLSIRFSSKEYWSGLWFSTAGDPNPGIKPVSLGSLELAGRFFTTAPPWNQLLLLLSHFSPVQLCATPETAAHQAPPSLGFSRQEHWSGLPFPSPMHESKKWKWSRSVVSNSSRPHGLQPTKLPRPWDSPGEYWSGVPYVNKYPFPLEPSSHTPNPLQCSCLENPRDGGAYWAAISGVTQSRTWLKRLSSSSSVLFYLSSSSYVSQWRNFPKIICQPNFDLFYYFLFSVPHRKRCDFLISKLEEGIEHAYFSSTIPPFSVRDCV